MTRRIRGGWTFGVVATLMCFLAGCASKQERQERAIGAAAGEKVAFVDELAKTQLGSIALGALALEKSNDTRVRTLAQGLVDEYTRNLTSLGEWARSRITELGRVGAANAEGVGGSGEPSEAGMEELSKKLDAYAAVASAKESEALAKYRELEALSGAEFDKAFIEAVEENQKRGRKLTQKGMDDYKNDLTLASLLRTADSGFERNEQTARTLTDMMKQ